MPSLHINNRSNRRRQEPTSLIQMACNTHPQLSQANAEFQLNTCSEEALIAICICQLGLTNCKIGRQNKSFSTTYQHSSCVRNFNASVLVSIQSIGTPESQPPRGERACFWSQEPIFPKGKGSVLTQLFFCT